MKKLLLVLMILMLCLACIGCNDKVEPITDANESTIIKDAKTTDEFIKKDDLNSIVYAYIYNVKEGINSYKNEISGSIKAKILVIDYDIVFSSLILKKGSTFYEKDQSKSTFLNVDSEYYMRDKERILVSRDMKEYKVWTMEDYHKMESTFDQFTLSGFVFNDESILKAELIENSDDKVSIKYVLDNELSTKIIKQSIYYTGGLSEYPTFSKVEFVVNLKKDFTPISYEFTSIYDAKKAVLGTSTLTQYLKCDYFNVNENIEIPNESFYIEKLGGETQRYEANTENTIKDELLSSVTALPFKDGINIDGSFVLFIAMLESNMNLSISSSVVLDTELLTEEDLYAVPKFYSKLEGDEGLNSLLGIVGSVAKEKLGEYASLLDGFNGIEIFYTGDGRLLLVPYNSNGIRYTYLELKLTDIIDAILKKVNIYNLVTNSSNDLVEFEKIESGVEGKYTINVILHEDTIASIKETIENLILNDTTGMIKMVLKYKEFDSLDIRIDVEDNKAKKLSVLCNYIMENGEGEEAEGIKQNLFTLSLNVENLNCDFSKVDEAKEFVEVYNSVQDIKSRIKYYSSHVYLSKSYIAECREIIAEFEGLSEAQKELLDESSINMISSNIERIEGAMPFFATFYKFDFDNLDNKSIYEIMVAYREVSNYSAILMDFLSNEDYSKLNNLSDNIDYSIVDVAIFKLMSSDETTWNLTEEELNDFYYIVKIGELDSGVMFNMMFKIMTVNPSLDYNTFAGKIISLKESN